MLTNVALPGLEGVPTLSTEGVTTTLVERDAFIAREALRRKRIVQLRERLRALNDQRSSPEPLRQVVVTFTLGERGSSALVEWRAHGVGGPRTVRRVDGALNIDPSRVRRLGPVVALLVLLRALERVSDIDPQ